MSPRTGPHREADTAREEERKIDLMATLEWESNQAISALRKIKKVKRASTARKLAEKTLREID